MVLYMTYVLLYMTMRKLVRRVVYWRELDGPSRIFLEAVVPVIVL